VPSGLLLNISMKTSDDKFDLEHSLCWTRTLGDKLTAIDQEHLTIGGVLARCDQPDQSSRVTGQLYIDLSLFDPPEAFARAQARVESDLDLVDLLDARVKREGTSRSTKSKASRYRSSSSSRVGARAGKPRSSGMLTPKRPASRESSSRTVETCEKY
jgi:hypothetical protein